ncbi:uncharacterized protein SPPG_01508 [Spizellomyces punctatus DAOM BR117]|uniref:Uncharacterized protein n=1 Tax=Spizellomyces punctatus (strain DAOM BR117) TaxID=645134 RepID=A0A0L0HRU2_SPIPD|nr:uncharacterized protein SPPG_01508 [Spizellomyces punctatus DAOM BR117]KND04066.1 hypothetical protein SPPG_01508 [Spizellomyces punctatus DAOM BR117]|eukprot:XP_016612105.1 hypothetical protein SPPG_01508 [Spizellomyces punctatus DAOM BR117]
MDYIVPGLTVGKYIWQCGPTTLCCQWSKDSEKIFCGSSNGIGAVLDLQTPQPMPFARHAAPLRCIRVVDDAVVCTAGWDKQMKYWDLRAPNSVLTSETPERAKSMDFATSLLVVGMENKKIGVYDMRKPCEPLKGDQGPLRRPIQCVSVSPSGTSYACGGVDGHVAVEYADRQGYIFRAQEEAQTPVNCMAFHPVFGALATGGADGVCNFWDITQRRRLKRSIQASSSITSLTFNPNDSFGEAKIHKKPRTHGQPIKVTLRAVTNSEATPLPMDI